MVVLNDTSSIDNVPEFSVSELSGAIKRSLEQGFSHVRVRAEAGRVTIAKSGHVYLDLKDADAVINAIIWKGVAQNLKTMPTEGMEVIATGRITTFPGQSKYQLIIEKLEPAGLGAILLQLEERRKKLLAEGLFDPSRKQEIPFLPTTIGVVTSPTGAVIRDILHRLSDRFPVHVLVWRVLVQGDKAAAQIAHAIEGFNAIKANGAVPRPDLIIVARGGGSIEDLWAFNEEIVVRAAAASKIPLISAVGHETDTTLIDYASDLRAPTPTGAAEKAVPVRNELLANLAGFDGRLKNGLLRRLSASKLEFRAANAKMPRADNLFATKRQRLDIIDLKLAPSLGRVVQNARLKYSKLAGKMQPQILLTDLGVKRAHLKSFEERRIGAFSRLIKRQNENAQNELGKLNQIWGRAQIAWKNASEKRLAKIDANQKLLNSLDYKNVLKRGYAIIQNDAGVLKTKAEIENAKNFNIIVQDGDIAAQIASKKPVQGSLF